ncbi:hypothetical protein BJ138DRAFT_1064336 [Hygrophoropsis aurantiaca]|uniref:Uncharacterized protein n=1 Tax=Hygrophoropsis aurantiaca TaxID=72124 RepID=A0ACB8ABS9_9AGAM|nr:hypothetical protein BJ138DRAFT_1064336 [Hygrophoropsis aurantiaca]
MVQKHNHGVPFSLADILDIALRTPLPPLDHDEIYEAARQIQLPAPDEEEELEIAQLIPLPPLDHNEVYEMACQIPLPAPDSDEVLETAQLTQLPPLDHDEVCEAARQIPLPPPDSDEVLETAQFTCLPSLDDEEILESARLTLLPPPDQEEIFQFSLLVSLPAPDVEESYSWALQIVLPAIDAEEELYFNTAEGEIAPYIKLSPSALRRKRRFALKVRQEQFSETFKMVPQATSSMVGCESNEQAAEISKIAPAVPLLTSESIEQAAETSKLVSESPPTAVVCGSTERPLTTRKQRQRANRRLGYGPKAASVPRETSELAPLPVSAATAVDNSEVTTGTNESPESASLINRAQVPVHSSARANTGFYHNVWEEQETPLCPFPVHVDPYIPSSAYLGPLDEVDRRIAWMEANATETNWERSSSTSSAARNRPSHSLCMRRR